MNSKATKKEVNEKVIYDVTVWAYKRLPELNNQTGFVQVKEDVAEKLLKTGDVQSLEEGSLGFKYIEEEKSVDSQAKDMTTKDVKQSSKTTKSMNK